MIYEATANPTLQVGLELVAILLYFAMIFLRFKTGQRVYNVIGVAILTYLAFLFIDSIPMVIAFFGLILFTIYDTFWGTN